MTHVFPGTYDTSGTYSRPLSKGPNKILEPEIIVLQSEADGVDLQLGIVRPDLPAGASAPVILIASPLLDNMSPESIKENPQRDQITWFTFNHYDYYVESFVPHGYAVAFMATRGTGGSGGCWTRFGAEEQSDVNQVIDWLATQSWSSGNVGMVGISFEGTTPWMAAATGNAHLKTIVPVEGYTDFFRADFRNGTFGEDPTGPLAIALAYPWGIGLEPRSLFGGDPSGATNPGNRDPSHRAEGAQCRVIAEHQAAYGYSATQLTRDPFGYYDARNFRPGVEEKYRGSVFVIDGTWPTQSSSGFLLQDYPWLRKLEDKGIVIKHMVGQWGHDFPDSTIAAGNPNKNYRWDFQEVLLHWFDYWLKDRKATDLGPIAQIQDHTGKWHSEAAWPPRDAALLRFYPTAGALKTAPGSAASWVQLCPPPETPACATQATFSTEPLTSDVRISGFVGASIKVRALAHGGIVGASLYLDEGDGPELLARGLVDLRLADGTEQPKPVVPGQAVEAKLQLWPVDALLPAGARVILEIDAGSWRDSGILGIGPGIAGLPAGPGSSAGPIEVSVGGADSFLAMPTIVRGADAFFEPPAAKSTSEQGSGLGAPHEL